MLIRGGLGFASTISLESSLEVFSSMVFFCSSFQLEQCRCRLSRVQGIPLVLKICVLLSSSHQYLRRVGFYLGSSWVLPACSWFYESSTWLLPGSHRALPGFILGPTGLCLVPLGFYLGSSWALPGSTWFHLGSTWVLPGFYLGSTWIPRGSYRAILGSQCSI